MKPLVIYHDNCADGFGAAFAAWLKLGDDAEYLPMQYGHPTIDSMFGKGREVYILDFSLPKPQMEQLFRVAERVVWLDHHAPLFKDYGLPLDKVITEDEFFGNPYEPHYILLDNSRSGALIAWQFFHPDTKVPMLINHIDDYDRWVFALKGTKAFNKALWSYAPWSFGQWQEFLSDDDFYGQCWTEGSAILRAHEQNVQAVVKGSARECNITSFGPERFGLAANCPPHLTSDVGHELATQSGTFGLCWTLSQTGFTAKCSLRSNGDYDVSTIAKAFGGGGHRNAAGFEVPIETLLGWLK